MKTYDFKDVEVVAHHEVAMGKLVVYALLDGVEVPLAAHKMGNFAHLLKEAAEGKVKEAEAKAATLATATVEVPVEPHVAGVPAPATTPVSPTVTQ